MSVEPPNDPAEEPSAQDESAPQAQPEATEPAPEPEAPAAKPRRLGRSLLIALAVVLGVVTMLCLGGLGTAFFAYDKATEIDRGTPGVSTRQYLKATLDERDQTKARLFVCRGATDLDEVSRLLQEIEGKESQFGVTIRTAPEGFDAKQAGREATVRAKLRLSVTSNGSFQEQIQSWEFALKDQSGWRVCGARRVA